MRKLPYFRISLFLLTLSVCACARDSRETNTIDSKDIAILAHELLAVSHPSLMDESGRANELKTYKALEKIYLRARDLPDGRDRHTEKQLKTLMMFALYAENRNSAAFNEALASDLMPVVLDNPDRFLGMLASQPVMVPPVCDRLNAYFGFEGKHLDEKSGTMDVLTPKIQSHLGESEAESCLQAFE